MQMRRWGRRAWVGALGVVVVISGLLCISHFRTATVAVSSSLRPGALLGQPRLMTEAELGVVAGDCNQLCQMTSQKCNWNLPPQEGDSECAKKYLTDECEYDGALCNGWPADAPFNYACLSAAGYTCIYQSPPTPCQTATRKDCFDGYPTLKCQCRTTPGDPPPATRGTWTKC